MTTWYDSYEAALARVNAVRRAPGGHWPGIVGPCGPDLRWRLTFDPELP